MYRILIISRDYVTPIDERPRENERYNESYNFHEEVKGQIGGVPVGPYAFPDTHTIVKIPKMPKFVFKLRKPNFLEILGF